MNEFDRGRWEKENGSRHAGIRVLSNIPHPNGSWVWKFPISTTHVAYSPIAWGNMGMDVSMIQQQLQMHEDVRTLAGVALSRRKHSAAANKKKLSVYLKWNPN